MTKAELEERVKRLRELDRLQMDEERYRNVWMYEVMRMLKRRSIEDCTDSFFGFERLVGKDLDEVVANESFKEISKNGNSKRLFYKWIETSNIIYGYIDEDTSYHTYSAAVFAAPSGTQQFQCVLRFSNFKNLITARLALSMLMIMMDRNDCSITRMYSPSLKECIENEKLQGFILSTYRTIDDRYHFAVIANEVV